MIRAAVIALVVSALVALATACVRKVELHPDARVQTPDGATDDGGSNLFDAGSSNDGGGGDGGSVLDAPSD